MLGCAGCLSFSSSSLVICHFSNVPKYVFQGEDGSALAVSDGLDGNVLIGLLTFAKSSPAPAVFTKISYHVDWILDQQSKAD